ncbi:MAG TPA: hypothetical protein VF792_03675 [Ktedonobacterales bacterium]
MTIPSESTLDALRRGGQEARAVCPMLAYQGDEANQDERSQLRAAVVMSLAGSLCAADASIARRLLLEETVMLETAGVGATEALFTLVAIVARFANPADVWLLWRARQATPETRLGVDVEQVGRLGIEQSRAILEQAASGDGSNADDARQALAWITQGADSGAFDDLAGYFAWSDDRFGLTVAGST